MPKKVYEYEAVAGQNRYGPCHVVRVKGDGSSRGWIAGSWGKAEYEAKAVNRLIEQANAFGDLRDALKELVRCVRGGDRTEGVSMDDALMDADAALERAGDR